MQLFAIGLNHETAAVSVREKLAFTSDKLAVATRELGQQPALQEVAILSTCNRTEIYCHSDNLPNQVAYEKVLPWLSQYSGMAATDLSKMLYRYPNEAAVKHAFRVAAGLDSMVLGESQILGQMKQAFNVANEVGTAGQLLNHLFQRTFNVAKRIRSDTGVGSNAVSVAYAGVTLAKRLFEDLSSQTVLLIGAGETIELVAQHLKRHNVKHIIIANRSRQRAQTLAKAMRCDVDVIDFAQIPEKIVEADMVVTSTASTLPILGVGMLTEALKKRHYKPMFMLDLAVPRDVETGVSNLRNVYLYTVDDLKNVITENQQRREEAAAQAENIIDLEVVRFMRWMRSLNAVPDIVQFRQGLKKIEQQELQKVLRELENGMSPEQALRQLSHSLVNKFAHKPTHALRRASIEGDQKLTQQLLSFFELDQD